MPAKNFCVSMNFHQKVGLDFTENLPLKSWERLEHLFIYVSMNLQYDPFLHLGFFPMKKDLIMQYRVDFLNTFYVAQQLHFFSVIVKGLFLLLLIHLKFKNVNTDCWFSRFSLIFHHIAVFISFIFISWRLITLQYCGGFVIQWHESAMDLHVFPILILTPTSLSTRFLWVFPVHQVRALVSCIQPGLVICFTLDNKHVSMLFSRNIPHSTICSHSSDLVGLSTGHSAKMEQVAIEQCVI